MMHVLSEADHDRRRFWYARHHPWATICSNTARLVCRPHRASLTAMAPSRAPPRRACDSFQGLPERQRQDDQCGRPKSVPNPRCVTYHGRGVFAAPLTTFHRNVRKFGVLTAGGERFDESRMQIVKGWFNESLPPAGLSQISYLRLDGDLYVSTRDPLKALYDKLAWGGVVFVDDYGAWAGCAKAVDDHFEAHDLSAPIRTIPRDKFNDGLGDAKFGAVWWAKQALCCGYASCAWCT